MTLATGSVLIDRYRVVRLLGQGGFGAVYRVWDLHLNGPFALKENLDTSPEAIRQFTREAQILASLRHPNLPRVTDHFSLPDQGQYLVMEYVEGEDLEEKRCKSTCQPPGSLPEEQVLTWTSQILDALEYLHCQEPPIIHRDIKPANIRITPQGRAMLVDFGIAKIFNPVLKTTIGARAITPGYSPLEQYGQGTTDARSDIYALGATLYVLLTGQTPPESTARAWNDPLQHPNQVNQRLSPATSLAISKAMQTDPVNRWQNIAEFRAALQAAMHEQLSISIPEDGHPLEAKKNVHVAQNVVLVAPINPLPETTPMDAGSPVPVTPQRNVAPTKVIAPTRKSRLGWILAGGAVVLMLACAALICYLNSVGSQLLESTRTAKSQSTSSAFLGVISTPRSPAPGQFLKIGLLMPFSGPVPAFGKSTLEGASLAVQEWNDKGGVLGRQILLMPEDSQCSADPAVKAANKLIQQDNVRYIVGEICSAATIPASEVTDPNNVVLISPTSTNPAVTVDRNGQTKKFTFRACMIDPFQGSAMARFAIQRGYQTAFIMSDPDNVYVTGLADAFEATFSGAGGRIVGREPHRADQTDFSATLEKVAASQADILYIPDYYSIVNLIGAQAKKRALKISIDGRRWLGFR